MKLTVLKLTDVKDHGLQDQLPKHHLCFTFSTSVYLNPDITYIIK